MNHPSSKNESAAWRALYPFESKFAVVSGSHKMHFVEEGTGDPILFVHGNPTWSFYWRKLIQAFSHEHRCLAVDHIGMGLSDKPSEYEYRLSTHVENLAEFIEQQDLQNITMVMHDWGGAIGSGAAIKHSARIKQLCYLNTATFPPPYIPKRIQLVHIPLFGSLAVRGFNGFSKAAISMATNLPDGLDSAVSEGLLAPYDSWANRVAVYNFVKDIPRSKNHPTWKTLVDIETELAIFKDHPALMIWGMKDWCFRPECMDRINEILPNAQRTEIADAGHYVVEDAPDRVIESIRQVLLSK